MLVLAAFLSAALEPTFAPVAAQHDMSRMTEASGVSLPLGVPLSRLGSGTSWMPDSSRPAMIHAAVSGWTLMAHGAVFGQFDRQNTARGGSQAGLVDWEMATALRAAGGGVLSATVGTSIEALVDGPRGYPELLQSGGAYQDARIANRQHPHPALMQLSAAYDRKLMPELAFSVYGAAVGEPALGPVSFMHRASANDDPFAPLAHHWEDATHDASGVVTAGVYTDRVKLEASAFNARESGSGDKVPDYTGARLDSYSSRVSVAAGGRLTLSAWTGYIFDHDPLDPGTGMQRYGASVLASLRGMRGGRWSSALVWGLDVHHHGARVHVHDSSAVVHAHHLGASGLFETALDLGPRTSAFGRLEQVQKTADDLGFIGGDLSQPFTIREVSLGLSRDVVSASAGRIGLGTRGTVNLIPETLRSTYGTRMPLGGAVFVSLKPPV